MREGLLQKRYTRIWPHKVSLQNPTNPNWLHPQAKSLQHNSVLRTKNKKMDTRNFSRPPSQPEFPEVCDVGRAGSDISGAQRDKDEIEVDEGHGAAILSLKSQVKLKPVELSKSTSAGKLRSRHPCCPYA